MNENTRLIKNTAIIAIGSLSTKIVSFFLLPLYTSILSTSEYGIVDYIITISVFCVPFVSLLLDESMFRFLIDCKTQQDKARVISQSMLLILFGGAVFVAVAIPVLHVLRYGYSFFLILYVLSAVLVTMTSALLRGIGRIGWYAVFNCLNSVFTILLNILFIAILRWGVQGMLLASILAQAGVSAIFLVMVRLWRYIDLKTLDKVQIKEMLRYSLPLIPNKLSWTIINLSNRIVIMNLIGSDANGLYAVSNKFPTLMDTVYGFFYQSWKESSARVAGDVSRDAFYNSVYRYLKDFMYTVVLVMVAFMPLAFRLLVNEAYHEAIWYVPILLLATYFSNISGFYGGIFTAYKETNIMGITTMVSAGINLAGGIVLTYFYGLYGAAAATLAANIIVYLYRKIKVKRFVVLKENSAKQVAAIGATVAVTVLFYSQNMLCQMLGVVVSVGYGVWANLGFLKLAVGEMKKKLGR